MFDNLPDYIDPIASVNHHKRFQGRVNQAKLKRLVDAIAETNGDVLVDIQFYYDKAVKFPAYKMKLETNLLLECQRSLGSFEYPVTSESQGVLTETMALVDDLPSDFEVLELDPEEERISLHQWVEEELLLSIPMVPIDENAKMLIEQEDDVQDGLPEGRSESNDLHEEVIESKPNPFAALKALKDK